MNVPSKFTKARTPRRQRTSHTPTQIEPQSSRWWSQYLKRLLPILIVTILPLTHRSDLWSNVWFGTRARAWDGTGHFTLAQIYNQSIFPSTFGWTHAYFAGMPFPNFYPPLFYWCVALLSHTQLMSFVVAFKLVLITPVLLLPAAIWVLAFALSRRDKIVASGAAIGILPMLVDYHLLHPVGLNHQGTFLIGLYTQPLGFVLLIAWYVVYAKPDRQLWRFALASILLALTVLANFFTAVTAAIFVLTTLANDLVRLLQTANEVEACGKRNSVLFHLGSPLVAFCLSLFWLVPMVSQYEYFVTRPHASPFNELVSSVMWVWYLLAAIGIWQWKKRPTTFRPFLVTCLVLAAGVTFATLVSPRWFSLQTPRFLSILNFLLAVPVGFTIRSGLNRIALVTHESLSEEKVLSRSERRLAERRGKRSSRWLDAFRQAPITYSVGIILVIVVLVAIQPADYTYVFYKTEASEEIDGVLNFARAHRDARYLVEVPFVSRPDAALDGRAINSFLGAQGNEALSVVFREASPNSIFFNPLAGAFAESADNFGISTVLADDLDFVQQPFEFHIDRARFVGVRYLIVATLWIKNHLIGLEAIGPRHDFGVWSIFELRDPPPEKVRILPYKPALVVSNLSLKERRSNEREFIRWAEEQFNDDWFDVLLVQSPETNLERLTDLHNFGALILDSYNYLDENRAFEVLKGFAQDRTLILLSSNNKLFQRIVTERIQFPMLEIIQRANVEAGQPLNALQPNNHHGSSPIREEWRTIRRALERNKMPIEKSQAEFTGQIDQYAIKVNYQPVQNGNAVPVLVATTFHPNWHRSDGQAIYATTPFFMLLFVDKAVDLVYGRRWFEKIALWFSAVTFISLCAVTAWHYRSHRRQATSCID